MSLNRRLSTVPANNNTADKYTVDVVRMAHIVPIGIDFWASAKSPDLLDPAIIPKINYLCQNSNTQKWLGQLISCLTHGKNIIIILTISKHHCIIKTNNTLKNNFVNTK